ncbi:MAG: hypothetical protein JJU05_12575 [Verrucomicrobia bacterium]|nr:hypothetical protein [Verrucomicrobiota bacterium]MCH8528394.1 hypothetical protein [Kiritimatiellia bacterium]
MIRALTDADRPGFGARHVFMLLGALLLVAGGLRLIVLYQRQGQLRQGLEDLRQEVEVFEAGEGGRPLQELLLRDRARYAYLVREWGALEPRVQQFRQKSLAEIFPRNPEGRIDFKIAIIEARQLLLKLSQEHVTVLPPHLGIPDTIAESEQAEIRQGQLTATLRILVKCIRMDIPEILQVQSLPPVLYPREGGAAMMVYPVYVVFESSYEALARLLHEIQNKELFFALQHLHVESQFPEDPERLRVHVLWNAVGFGGPTAPETEPPPEDAEEPGFVSWTGIFDGEVVF